jgi:hypothetical protein
MDLKKLVALEQTITDPGKRQQVAGMFQKLIKDESQIRDLSELDGFKTLVRMLSEQDELIRKRISACICNMSCVDSTLEILRENNIIQALVDRLSDDNETLSVAENVAAAFMNLCLDQKTRQYIADHVPLTLASILKTCRKCTTQSANMDKQKEEIVYNMMVCCNLSFINNLDFIIWFGSESNSTIRVSKIRSTKLHLEHCH